jgi:hypothetical protein
VAGDLGPFLSPKKSAFYHSLFVARLRKLANPPAPKKTLGEAQPSFYWRDFDKKENKNLKIEKKK